MRAWLKWYLADRPWEEFQARSDEGCQLGMSQLIAVNYRWKLELAARGLCKPHSGPTVYLLGSHGHLKNSPR